VNLGELGPGDGNHFRGSVVEQQLADITGMAEVTVQPNSGAQGEFAGLRVIKKVGTVSRDRDQAQVALGIAPRLKVLLDNAKTGKLTSRLSARSTRTSWLRS
jgi:hypothetical protein